ncbi:hypothetical protein OF83DRAFT_1164431 [Amylostereum chailletii]|nr:hypothetical protein OF83DRAFT_1164431 [Amylostereum chailletii]
MDSLDSNSLSNVPSGSRLLSESPLSTPYPSSSHTGPGGDDLSLSELSLTDRLPRRPFSLLPHPEDTTFTLHDHDTTFTLHDHDTNMEELGARDEDQESKSEHSSARTREEKLQNDLFVLRKLNSAFAVYNEALKATESSTERVAAELEQTDALLNKYVRLLGNSEIATRLIFDERWQGADVDDDMIEKEVRQREERRRLEEEEQKRAIQREQERKEREERDKQAREEKERLDSEKKARISARSTSGVRGVRGTRASMRASASASRGGSRPAPAAPTSTRSSATSSHVSRIGRPPSVTTRGSTSAARGMSRRPGS